jgi:hypothetical protein
VALWFEAVRVVSVLYLVAVDRSLAFVPFLVPAAAVADWMVSNKRRGPFVGVAVAGVTVISNWVVLELLPGLRWPADDLMLGIPVALVAGAVAGWLGSSLGNRLEGETPTGAMREARRTAAVALLSGIVVLVAAPAHAHEVGGLRGTGTVTWTPGVPQAGETIDIGISDLSLDSGVRPQGLRVEAWRAEHRIRAMVDYEGKRGRAELTLPEQGLWFLFVRAEAGGENLLWGDHFTVAEEGEGVPGTHRQRFTLGVDTLAVDEPPAWVDLAAYGVAIVILLLLLRGVVKALSRLPSGAPVPSPPTG